MGLERFESAAKRTSNILQLKLTKRVANTRRVPSPAPYATK